MKNPLPILTGLLFFVCLMTIIENDSGASSRYDGYEEAPGLIDLRSSVSDGSHSIEDLARIADSRGFKVIFINDHDHITLSYGIPPFRNVLRYKREYPSIGSYGAGRYLDEIRRVSQNHPDMIIIPGCETSAYYYWTGSPFKKDLTVHEYDRRMIILNFNSPDDYRSIPNLHNGLSLKYTGRLIPGSLFFALPLLAGLILLRWNGFSRAMGFIIAFLSIVALINYNPFRSSLFTPYRGDQGVAPYQELIDYANKRGGFCFWNYPEQRSGVRKISPDHTNTFPLAHLMKSIGDIPVYADTPPYAHVLVESRDYTGFSAIYGDNIRATDPGREWDMALNEYCRGDRKRPPWGISAADFHEDGRLNLELGDFPTVFLVKEFSKKGILDSLAKGRFYCSRGDGRVWPRLSLFTVSEKGGREAIMGETLDVEDHPVIRFGVTYNWDVSRPVSIDLIRGGKLLRTFKGKTPMEIEYTDLDAPANEKTYYRLVDQRKHLTSNPIFVTYRPPGPRNVGMKESR